MPKYAGTNNLLSVILTLKFFNVQENFVAFMKRSPLLLKALLKTSFLMPRKRNVSLFGLEIQFLRASDLCQIVCFTECKKKGYNKNSDFPLRSEHKLSVDLKFAYYCSII